MNTNVILLMIMSSQLSFRVLALQMQFGCAFIFFPLYVSAYNIFKI